MLFLVLAAYAAAVLSDWTSVYRSGKARLVWPSLILLGIGAAVQALYELKVSIPSPAAPISFLISSIFGMQ